ncbi:MAG: tRNA guanosine(34) transglycosylase Tgt [Patescibacteria group bacterium]
MFKFVINKELQGTLARTGTISTPHGDIQTPAFVSVGTKGTVKGLSPKDISEAGTQVIIANTYHLYLAGDEKIKKLGGLHKFMNWNKPLMTDSGGFQVFSLGAAYGQKGVSKIGHRKHEDEIALPVTAPEDGLPKIARIDPNGVMFRSHSDGSAHYFTPEKSIEIQHNLGADIIFAFDECTSPYESLHYQKEALERTHRWAKRCLEYHKGTEHSKIQALFGIIQGGRDETLRKESAEFMAGLDFDGYGIGGSFEKEDMEKAVEWCNNILPKEKPRHLLGIGEPLDLFMAVEKGCDLFDCVAPTRLGRNGGVYTKDGKVNIYNQEYREDPGPIDEGCECYACKNFSRGYMAHLFHQKEMLAGVLASIHNTHFIVSMVDRMREEINSGDFLKYKKEFVERYYKNKLT